MTITPPETSLVEAEGADIYSASALGRLWLSTYKFAQGSADLQHGIVSLLFEGVLPPEVREDYERLERSFELARPLVRRTVNSAGHSKYTDLSQGSVDRNFSSDVADVIRRSQEKPTLDVLLEKILKRDGRYLPTNGNEIPRTHGAGREEYYSHAIRYILLKAKTSHPSMDQLFTRVRPFFEPLADQEIETSVTTRDAKSDVVEVTKHFTLQDIVGAHLAGNSKDRQPTRLALAELGISNEVITLAC